MRIYLYFDINLSSWKLVGKETPLLEVKLRHKERSDQF
jgi:hypothetical protein